MEYIFKAESPAEFSSLPNDVQKRIIGKLDFYMSVDDPLCFSKPLNGSKSGEYRFRIGDYRVIFEVKDGVVEILKIGNRKDIYR